MDRNALVRLAERLVPVPGQRRVRPQAPLNERPALGPLRDGLVPLVQRPGRGGCHGETAQAGLRRAGRRLGHHTGRAEQEAEAQQGPAHGPGAPMALSPGYHVPILYLKSSARAVHPE